MDIKEVFSGETVSGTVRLGWSGETIDTSQLADGVREFFYKDTPHYLNVLNGPIPGADVLAEWKKEWEKMVGTPSDYDFERKTVLLKKFSGPGFTGELYLQNNAPGKVQKSVLLLPEKGKAPYPVVIMPFYYPGQVIGFDPETGEKTVIPGRSENSWNRGARLAAEGFAVLSCESYYITYIKGDLPLDFSRWAKAAGELKKDHPSWSGVGKLVADNLLLADFAEADSRLDSSRIAVMGHSLGGKIAFYAGSFDPRIKAAVASDWGIGWHQTNWEDIWYWGGKVKEMEKKNMEHSQIMAFSQTPTLMIAGQYDNISCTAFISRASAICGGKCDFQLDNHGSGHCIPAKSFDNAVRFLRKHLEII